MELAVALQAMLNLLEPRLCHQVFTQAIEGWRAFSHWPKLSNHSCPPCLQSPQWDANRPDVVVFAPHAIGLLFRLTSPHWIDWIALETKFKQLLCSLELSYREFAMILLSSLSKLLMPNELSHQYEWNCYLLRHVFAPSSISLASQNVKGTWCYMSWCSRAKSPSKSLKSFEVLCHCHFPRVFIFPCLLFQQDNPCTEQTSSIQYPWNLK